ncbi:MAG: hypothetical protein MJK18_08155 [Bdellovibrionales bacterium]|nr:hypothetical protein [Bdellovibrionales bacterium]
MASRKEYLVKLKINKAILVIIPVITVTRLIFLNHLGWSFNPNNLYEYIYLGFCALLSGIFLYKPMTELFGINKSLVPGDDGSEDFIVEWNSHLKNTNLYFLNYKSQKHWDHDHCVFCGVIITDKKSDDFIDQGYFSKDCGDWICSSCFDEYKNKMRWTGDQNGE